jgi:hypothetical protein
MLRMLTLQKNCSKIRYEVPLKVVTGQASGTIKKQAYRALCLNESSVPLFSRDWWLDAAVGPNGWDVAVVMNEKHIVAALPYVIRQRYSMRILTQPALTPMLGPWIRDKRSGETKQLSRENELMEMLIDQLPRFDHFAQAWHPKIANWRPFFWSGFQQTTYYTYVIPDLSNKEKLWAGLDGNLRRTIMTAQKKHGLQVREDMSLDVLLELNRKTFARQGLRLPYPDEFVRRLDAACVERGCRKLLVVVDSAGVPISGYYYVWDENSAYGLIAGSDPLYRHTGANSLCLWETIRHSAHVTHQYNFCGSMLRPVEGYLRSFGGNQVPYFRVSKTRSRLLVVRECILSLTNRRQR